MIWRAIDSELLLEAFESMRQVTNASGAVSPGRTFQFLRLPSGQAYGETLSSVSLGVWLRRLRLGRMDGHHRISSFTRSLLRPRHGTLPDPRPLERRCYAAHVVQSLVVCLFQPHQPHRPVR